LVTNNILRKRIMENEFECGRREQEREKGSVGGKGRNVGDSLPCISNHNSPCGRVSLVTNKIL
jgi:hypothetical protein